MLPIELRLDLLWAKAIKLRDRCCVSCGKPTTDACHVIPRRHKATRWLLQNGQGKCRECHNKETPEILKREVPEYEALQELANEPYPKEDVFLEARLRILLMFIEGISEP